MIRTSATAFVIIFTLSSGPDVSAQPWRIADSQSQIASERVPTYADLADLADSAQLVIRAKIRKQATLEPERAPGLPPHMARIYVEADTLNLIGGNVPVGGSLRYLVDLPRDSRGKVPRIRKQEVILFANPVPGRPGELQLVAPSAQLPWSEEAEGRLRPILRELVSPDAPSAIGDVREALSVAGNLAGESETQFFVGTRAGGPVSISVIRRPGADPVWGVSWSEIVDQAARPPRRNTLGWYRLACFLPASLPASANYSDDPQARLRAEEDFRFVRSQLGTCPRNRNLN